VKSEEPTCFPEDVQQKEDMYEQTFFSVPGTWGSHQVRGSLFLPQKTFKSSGLSMPGMMPGLPGAGCNVAMIWRKYQVISSCLQMILHI